jgi:catechol 2,3-dioxygenase-like lactoylglutathione lyase family enzyme
MTILRIETITYGVEDVEACTRFYSDVGFEKLDASPSGSLFRTPANQNVEIRRLNDPSLPPPTSPGSGIRETTWGVDSHEGLESIGRELSRDREVSVGADGVLHSRDMTGFGIAFKLADVVPVAEWVREYNYPTHINRVNRGLSVHGRPRPVRLLHVAMDIPKDGHDAANDFYLRRLRFKAVDDSRPVGIFMQCEGDLLHHNLLLVHRTDRASTNHVAFEVRDFDEVIEAGNFMTDRGWKESRRLGRHTLGSNVFRFIQAPCGGRIEFAHDMDRMDKSWKTRVWETAPPHHMWMIKFPGDTGRGD